MPLPRRWLPYFSSRRTLDDSSPPCLLFPMAPSVDVPRSFSETVKRSLGSDPPLLVVHEAPALTTPVIQDAMDHVVHYSSHALVCRFNGLWPRLSDLHSWVSSEWNPLLKEGAIIFPCAKWFFYCNICFCRR